MIALLYALRSVSYPTYFMYGYTTYSRCSKVSVHPRVLALFPRGGPTRIIDSVVNSL